MIETPNELDPELQIPVFSLYGEVRRPTREMLDTFDLILIDLQDIGCRIYTFITTLLYVMEECAKAGKTVWVLDRPNPAGREVEGMTLRPGQESFVGAAPIPMRHGLTLGELALWFRDYFQLNLDLEVIPMADYAINAAPGYGWPEGLAWVNPSPNAATLNMTRCYAGSVMLEGTTLSEGRGTTRPLELWGAPDIDTGAVLRMLERLAPGWSDGCRVRELAFEPTFYKHSGKLCRGFQVHTDGAFYEPQRFKPYRLFALFFKAIRLLEPNYPLWRDFPYEYVTDRLAIDVINGGSQLRQWVDDPAATLPDLDNLLVPDERGWIEARRGMIQYG